MATVDLQVTSVIEAVGSWVGATAANLSSSDDSRAINGVKFDTIKVDIDNAPGDFGSQNSVTLVIEGQVSGVTERDRQLQVDLLDSADTVLQTFTTGILVQTDTIYTSATFTRSDSQAVIDGYRILITVLEGGGMADTAFVEVDHVYATLDYNIAGAGQDLVRVADEGVASSEVKLSPRAMSRLSTEGMGLTESSVRSLATVLVRIVNEIFEVIEEGQPPVGEALVKVVDHAMGLIEQVARFISLNRLSSGVVGIGSAALRSRGMARHHFEVEGVADQRVRSMLLNRLRLDDVAVSEARTRARSMLRHTVEAEGVTESKVGIRDRLQVISDALGITEATNTIVTQIGESLFRIVSETLDITEAFAQHLGLTRTSYETVGATETTSRPRVLTRLRDDVISITEAIRTSRALARLKSEVVQIAETSVELVEEVISVVVRVVADILGLSESDPVRTREMSRLQAETIVSDEVTLRPRTMARYIDEVLGLADQSVPVRVLIRISVGAVGIVETTSKLLDALFGSLPVPGIRIVKVGGENRSAIVSSELRSVKPEK